MTGGSSRQRCATLVALAVLATAAFATAPGYAARSAAQDHGKSEDHPSSSSDDGNRNNNQDGDQGYEGVVQSVSATKIIARALDGSVVSVPIDAKTRYFVGDRPANLNEIKLGFVVTAKWKDGHTADEVRAFDPSPQSSVSVVASVGADRILVTAPDGSTATIRVSGKSRVFVNGKTAKLRDVKPGYALVGANGTKNGKAAGDLRFLKR